MVLGNRGLIIVITLVNTMVECQDISMSPPNREGWVNPDEFFSPKTAIKLESIDKSEENKACSECQEQLKIWTEKFAECEKSDLRQGITNPITEESLFPIDRDAEKVDAAKVFFQKFIRTLLEISNLDTIDVESENKAEIRFSISNDQLTTLRKFAKNDNTKSIPLRKVDEILSAVFVKPYFTLPNVEVWMKKLPSIQIGSFFFSACLPAVWFLSVLVITRRAWTSFMWLFPAIFVSTFITTAHRMFEEAQLKQYEEMSKYPDIPEDCKGKSFSSYFVSIGQTDCTKYLRAHNIDPNLHITTGRILTDMFGKLIEDIMGHVGVGSVGFFKKFSELGFLNQLVVLPFGILLLCAVLILISLVVTGGSIRLPFLLGSLRFGDSERNAQEPSSYGTSDVPHISRILEAAPSASNITFNFNNHPASNVDQIVQSITQGLPRPSVPGPSLLGAGDAHQLMLEDRVSVLDKAPSSSSRFKPVRRQFAPLESKYKAGSKFGKFTKVRKLSL